MHMQRVFSKVKPLLDYYSNFMLQMDMILNYELFVTIKTTLTI
jgi:hypothetical protein